MKIRTWLFFGFSAVVVATAFWISGKPKSEVQARNEAPAPAAPARGGAKAPPVVSVSHAPNQAREVSLAQAPDGYKYRYFRKAEREQYKKKLLEYGLVKVKMNRQQLEEKLAATVGKLAAQRKIASLPTDEKKYGYFDTDHKQPLLSFSKLQSNCPQVTALTGEAVIKVGTSDGMAISGIYTRSGGDLPISLANCQFTVPPALSGFSSFNVMYNAQSAQNGHAR